MRWRRKTTRRLFLEATQKQTKKLDELIRIERAQLVALEELRGARTDAVLARLTQIESESAEARRNLQAVRSAVASATLHEVSTFYAERQLDFITTLETVRDGELSLTRFGDGEMRMMLRPEYRLRFQQNRPELQHALRAILTEQTDRTLVALPTLYHDRHWAGVWSDLWPDFREIGEGLPSFGNAHVSRPLFFQLYGDRGVALWRSIWDGRSATVVTGEGSRFELLPALFDGLDGARFVHTTPTDAFAELTTILQQLEDDDSDLVLIALGPAGSVLAHLLAARGRRALDVGHLSDSYLNVFEGGRWPEEKDLTAPPQP